MVVDLLAWKGQLLQVNDSAEFAPPKKKRRAFGRCPICNDPLDIVVVQNCHGEYYWSLQCTNACFPQGLYACQPFSDAINELYEIWIGKIFPAIKKYGLNRVIAPACPRCGKSLRLLPVVTPKGKVQLRPVCDNGCDLPPQWAIPIQNCSYQNLVTIVERWSRERNAFARWFAQPIDPRRYKSLTHIQCPVCGKVSQPVLVHSCSSIGCCDWSCGYCGAVLQQASYNKKKMRNRSGKIKIDVLGELKCAICGRTQAEIEAHKSRLEKHHIQPLSEQGTDDKENLMLLCRECHHVWHTMHDALRMEKPVKQSKIHIPAAARNDSDEQFYLEMPPIVPTPSSRFVLSGLFSRMLQLF